MKTAIKNILGIAVLGMSLAATSCSQYEPRGYEPVPALAKATGVEASVNGRSVTLNWTLPVTDMKIEAIRVSCDNGTPVVLAPDATSCTMKGQPMNQELMYTVKVQYENGYVSEGTSTMVIVPFVETKAAFLLLAEDAERAEHLELFKELMRKAWQRKVIDLRAWSQQVAALGREGSIRFYEYCSRLIRENFILNLREPALNALTEAEQQFCSRFSPYVNERNVIEIAQILDRAISDVRGNGNGKLISFDLAVQMILLLKR